MSRLLLTLCGACVLFAIGCATEVGHFSFIGKAYPAKPANYPVEVFTNSLPSRPFDRVAILDVHCEAQGWQTPNLKDNGLPKLLEQARKAGCDAIIEIEARKPANWTFETKTIHFTGTGIVYK